MPIGDYPILEVILRQLKYYGFDDVTISTGYLHELIRAYVDNRKNLDLDIKYVHEDAPLGTIGPLNLIQNIDENFLMMNGDILTDLNYRELMNAHLQKNAIATIATYQRDINSDFGVLEYDTELKIHSFREKPTFHFNVSMGVYIFNKEIVNLIPKHTSFGFDHLMYSLTAEKSPVYSFPYEGYWLDIGRQDDYERSIREFEQNKDKFLR